MCKVFKKVLFGFLLSALVSCSMTSQQKEKINGVSFVSSNKKVTSKNIQPLLNIHANYAAVMPFGFIKNINHATLGFNKDWQWFGEQTKGIQQYVKELHKHKIRVMIKPQIWVAKGEFTGTIEMTSEDDWLQFEKDYSNFILTFARIAAQEKVAIFCIGTELEKFVSNRPEYWKSLIAEVKLIYKGKITYAANWDEYTKTSFWEDLDYIGIDGYFPLSKEKTPKIATLKTAWEKHKGLMKKHTDSLNKQILFTEFGYRSVDYAAAKPWEVDYTKTSVNLTAQVNTTQALFEALWQEKWFAGGFIWKWFIDYENVGGKNNARFTPQNKPAENVIKEFYKSYDVN